MCKHLYVLFLFALALQFEASVESDFETRSKWVRDLKSFIQNIEEKNSEHLMTQAQREDLTGSLMFHYTGPEKTKSKYLN